MTEPSAAQDPSTVLQVPAPADLVVAPTPQDRVLVRPRAAGMVVAPTAQDRALAVAESSSCGCPPTVVALDGHARHCPTGATP